MEALAKRFETENYKNNNKQLLVDYGVPVSIVDAVCFKMAQNARLTGFEGTVTEHAELIMKDRDLLKGFIREAIMTNDL